MPLKTVAVKRGRKVSVTELQPMSTVQESPIDSPTVPVRYSLFPKAFEDAVHNRSSSAPVGECIRDSQTLPQPIQPVQPDQAPEPRTKIIWTSKQAKSPPLSPTNALGLSLPDVSKPSERQPRRQGPSKPKPNLTIAIHNEDKPPPPPPKSPRHSRDPSIQSAVSSMHGDCPDSATVATPSSIMRAALVDTHGSPIKTPAMLDAKQQTYFPPNGPVLVRKVDPGKDRARQAETETLQLPAQTTQKPVPAKASGPDVDKPMPSLPMPSSRFSAHIREVWDTEKSSGDKKMKGVPTATPTQSSAPTEAGLTGQSVSSDTLEKKNDDGSAQSAIAPPKGSSKVPSRDIRTPTPDLSSRPQSPANLLQTTTAGAKVLPILPTETGPRPRSATPDSALRVLKPVELKPASSDPAQTIQELSKQCEALHARYSSLRAERVKLSTAISASLREDKPGPDYATVLLDQHLSLNAINSSMDICFAKLKSLDCRKEEAMATFMRQIKTKSIFDEGRKSAMTSAKSPLTVVFTTESGRSTPDLTREPKSLTPEFGASGRFSPLPARMESPARLTPEVPQEAKFSSKPEGHERKDTMEPEKTVMREDTMVPEKRTTVILASPSPESLADSAPISPISSIDSHKTKRIRIKGTKAAKILGLVAQSANGTKGITLPDETSPKDASPGKHMELEVEIQPRKSAERRSAERKRAPPPPTPVVAMPKRKPPPPPPPRQGTNDSVSSTTGSSHTDSSPEAPEVKTPRGSVEAPLGLKSPKKGMLQTIQVFVDDDILDYYKGS